MDRSFHRFARQMVIFFVTRTFSIPKPSELAGAIEWRGGPPRINGWMLNSLASVPYFQPANTFNPYTSGYGHFVPVQTLPAASQINLLNHLNSSGSMMSYDSLRSQNRSQPEIQNLFTTAIHQNISGRQVLRTAEIFSDEKPRNTLTPPMLSEWIFS
jgi:hypothetical protein